MAKLSAKFVENLKPGPARREIPDAGCVGLYLISQPASGISRRAGPGLRFSTNFALSLAMVPSG